MVEMNRGLFITFEGGEGSGKTTQARLLHEHLSGIGWDAIMVREPGGTPLGEHVRKVLLHTESRGMHPLSELFLYLAGRKDHVMRVIEPALSNGTTVISDRFSDATLAYQGYGRGLDLSLIRRLDRLACGDLTPDMTFLLELGDAEEGLMRALARHRRMDTARAEGRFEEEEVSFHRRVLDGYRELAGSNPDRIAVIDGAGSVEEIHGAILDLLKERFSSRSWGG